MTSRNCQICQRALTNKESIRKGIGPECEEKQQSFLASCGSSLEEVSQLSVLDDQTVLRWLTKFAGAMRAGRVDHGRRFIEAARAACSSYSPA
jgi:hypothetical protein